VGEVIDEPGRSRDLNCLQQCEERCLEKCQLRYDVDRSSALALEVMQAII
jgi:hypothetical protein